jgi:putative ABC transport system permease protein
MPISASSFKIAWRSILRNRFFSLINVSGLALGTVCCLYIMIYVKDQFDYDRHHTHSDDLYRVTTLLNARGDETFMATCSPPIGPALERDFEEVTAYTRVVRMEKMGIAQNLISVGDNKLYEKNAILADSSFFSLFDYRFLEGNSQEALKKPNSVVLDKSLAEKLFGTAEARGQVIKIENNNGISDFEVTGVVDTSLGKSHLDASLFVSMNSGGLGEYVLGNNVWAGNNFTSTYVRFLSGTDPEIFESKLPSFLKKYGEEELRNVGMSKTLVLQPVGEIHTFTGYDIEMAEIISPTFLYVLFCIAVLIQVVACINFMNLATAKATKRGKEVGVRKVIGASKANLITQFLGESLLLVLISSALAVLLFSVLLPVLNGLTGATIDSGIFLNWSSWLIIAGIVLSTGLLAGVYPAFYLTSFNTVKIMKGDYSNRISATRIRQVMVVTQFVFSIILISGVTMIQQQMNFLNNMDLGFSKEQRLIFSFYSAESKAQMDAFVDAVRQFPEVDQVSKTNNYPSQFVFNDVGVYLEGDDMNVAKNAQFMVSDQYFVPANGISLISGRDLREGDEGKVLINEQLMAELSLTPETALGTKLYSQYGEEPTYVEVAGVMKDFHYNSLHQQIRPFMIQYTENAGRLTHLIVSVNSDNYEGILGKLESAWGRLMPDTPFDYAFLDQEVAQQYEKEQLLSSVISIFTQMTIFISCLGLLGLAAFSAEQRRKEIGVRKALGASVSNIVGLLSGEFVKLVLIAFLISIPLAWWAMDQWLNDFAYKVPIQWWMFGLAGCIALLVAVVTVSSQAWVAASADPVQSIRNE